MVSERKEIHKGLLLELSLEWTAATKTLKKSSGPSAKDITFTTIQVAREMLAIECFKAGLGNLIFSSLQFQEESKRKSSQRRRRGWQFSRNLKDRGAHKMVSICYKYLLAISFLYTSGVLSQLSGNKRNSWLESYCMEWMSIGTFFFNKCAHTSICSPSADNNCFMLRLILFSISTEVGCLDWWMDYY